MSGTLCPGMALNMICKTGEMGEVKMLMPMSRRAIPNVRAAVMGDVDLAREMDDSEVSRYSLNVSGKPVARAKARIGIQQGMSL